MIRQPTPEQEAVLDEPARVRVVRAVPGSGKTWLVAEIIKRELEGWQPGKGAVAALSFTRVAGEEIRAAVGVPLAHPHYVGTLDAFIFRYVVRPFLIQVSPDLRPPRLLPAEWAPERWRTQHGGCLFEVASASDPSKRFSVFAACFVGVNGTEPEIGHPKPYEGGLALLNAQDRARVLAKKRDVWQKIGWVTHSDCAFLAHRILSHPKSGPLVIASILRRFAFIAVDELQDTGWFLGHSLARLLASPDCRGLLVGDPDQAIYEFNGARPELFDSFSKVPQAKTLALGKSLRCSPGVCALASDLSHCQKTVQASDARAGSAYLLSYNDVTADISGLRAQLATGFAAHAVKVIARHSKTVNDIRGVPSARAEALGSAPFNHLLHGVVEFRQGRSGPALACARAALSEVLTGHEGASDDEVSALGIELLEWRKAAAALLLAASSGPDGETIGAWADRLAPEFEQRLQPFRKGQKSLPQATKIRKPQAKHSDKPLPARASGKPGSAAGGHAIPITTVHAAKGETHDLTVLVCHQTCKGKCRWWSEDVEDKEERRIAFVGVTRTRSHLLLCVPLSCAVLSQPQHEAFRAHFKVMPITQFLASELPGLSVQTSSDRGG